VQSAQRRCFEARSRRVRVRPPGSAFTVVLAAAIAGAATTHAASPVPAESRQLLLSLSKGWNEPRAVVRLYERPSATDPWRVVGNSYRVSLGEKGLAWGIGLHPAGDPRGGPMKKEGDGRSPAGVYRLGEATGYEAAAPAGARLPYRQATPSLRCVDDPRSAHYNRLVDEGRVAKDWSSAEDMRRKDGLYRLVVWVGHNDAPPRAGAGSCIFLHFREKDADVTAGCTAFDEGAFETVFTWLDPNAHPILVQLPAALLPALAEAWGLPRE
jgi:D-alanyl-D-alanine dipeptidase